MPVRSAAIILRYGSIMEPQTSAQTVAMPWPAADTDQRSASRMILGRDGTARDLRQQPLDVIIEDLSASGCRLHCGVALPVNQVLNLGIPGVGRREGRVIWEATPGHGIEFLWPLSAEEVARTQTAESLVLGAFPQKLETLLQPDVAPDLTPRLSRTARAAIIASGSVALWIGCYVGLANLLG